MPHRVASNSAKVISSSALLASPANAGSRRPLRATGQGVRHAAFVCDLPMLHQPRTILVQFLDLLMSHERESVDGLVRVSER